MAGLLPRTPLITATLSLDLLHALIEQASSGPTLVLAPSEFMARRVESALRQRLPANHRARVAVADSGADLHALRREVDSVFVWPGCNGVLAAFDGDAFVRPVRLLSETTIDRVRTAVLDAAVRQPGALSTSNGAGPRTAAGVSAT